MKPEINKHLDAKNWAKASEVIQKAITAEQAWSEPDLFFLGAAWQGLAGVYVQLDQYSDFHAASAEAIKWYAQDGNDTSITAVLESLNAIYGLYPLFETTFGSKLSAETRNTQFFTVDSVLSHTATGATVLIRGGSLDGLYEAPQGWLYTVYNGDDPERGNKALGQAILTQIGPWVSTVDIEYSNSGDTSLRVLPNDHVEFRIKERPEGFRGIVHDLGLYNIRFQDINQEDIYEVRYLKEFDSPELTEHLLRYFVEDVIATTEWLDPENFMVLEGGRFHGMNLVHAMNQATTVDMMAFLQFVRSYPGKYMGHTWKINETFATWMLNATPDGDDPAWFVDSLMDRALQPGFDDYVNNYKAYITDTVNSLWFHRMDGMLVDARYEEVVALCTPYQEVGNALGNPAISGQTYRTIGWAYQQDSAWFKAVEWLTKATRLDENDLSAYWMRSNVYSAQEQWEPAIADLEVVIEGAPWFSSGFGNIGWYYVLLGEIEKAAPYITKAYELDSTEMAWAVNYGHLQLLTGKPELARRFYQRTLDLLESEDRFENGPKHDFEIFLEKGWHTTQVKREMEWMQDQYNRIYKYYVQANAVFEEAKQLKNVEEYDKALPKYTEALMLERKSERPRHDWENIYLGWIGYCYQKVGRYPEGVKYYREALETSRKFLAEDDIADNMELIGWIYRDMNDKVRSDAWYAEAATMKRLVEELRQSNDLYVLAIGIDSYADMKYEKAASDARAVGNIFRDKAGMLFNNVHIQVLDNANATRNAIEEAVMEVVSASKPGDTYIIYFAGKTEVHEGVAYMIPHGLSVDQRHMDDKALPVTHWRNWLSLVPATRQLLLIDANSAVFATQFIDYLATEGQVVASNRHTMVLGPQDGRLEREGEATSIWVASLMSGLNGEANLGTKADSMITAKELDAYLYQQLASRSIYQKTVSYAQGIDFKLAYTAKPVAGNVSKNPPEIVVLTPTLTRGGTVETEQPDTRLKVRVFSANGIKTAMLNGKPIELAEGREFATDYPLSMGNNVFVIHAEDVYGNSASDTMIVRRVPQRTVEKERTTFTFGTPQGRNIALIIATDRYQQWSTLNNPVRDGRTLASELSDKYGFMVDTLFNPTRREFLNKLMEYLSGNFTEHDRLLVFVAGHGVYDNMVNDGYLVMRDSEKDVVDKEDSYVSFRILSGRLNSTRFKQVFVMIDACYGGAFGDVSFSDGGDKVRLYLTSGSKEYVDDGPKGGHSPFASALFDILRKDGPQRGKLSASYLHVTLREEGNLTSKPRFGTFASSARDSEFELEYVQDGPVSFKKDTMK